MSEYYSKNLAREVMKGMRESALECKYVGGFMPYGFTVDKGTRRFLENEYEAEAVRMVFRDVANGHGYGEVLKKLNEMGYRTRLGNLFCKETLYEMLRNEKYNGVYVFSRASAKDERGRRNNHLSKAVEDQIRIPGGMPKLVDDDTFARVQAIMNSRKRMNRGKANRAYALTGMVFCGICGHRCCGREMQSGKAKTHVGIYTCNNRTNRGSHACQNRTVQQKPLEDFVYKRIGKLIFDERRIPAVIEATTTCVVKLSARARDGCAPSATA